MQQYMLYNGTWDAVGLITGICFVGCYDIISCDNSPLKNSVLCFSPKLKWRVLFFFLM